MGRLAFKLIASELRCLFILTVNNFGVFSGVSLRKGFKRRAHQKKVKKTKNEIGFFLFISPQPKSKVANFFVSSEGEEKKSRKRKIK
jgi:hypothetical protein